MKAVIFNQITVHNPDKKLTMNYCIWWYDTSCSLFIWKRAKVFP